MSDEYVELPGFKPSDKVKEKLEEKAAEEKLKALAEKEAKPSADEIAKHEMKEREKQEAYRQMSAVVAEYGGFSNIPINHDTYWSNRSKFT